jgi:cytidylate kinase
VTHASDTNKPPILIAIDGPAGAGKSTIARQLAARLRVPYLDTGAMYRAVGLLAMREGLLPPYSEGQGKRLGQLVQRHALDFRPEQGGFRVLIDGEDVSKQLRTPEASEAASAVSAVSAVRRALVPLQREMAAKNGGVMEGRDIGSVVLPDADLKVFLTAASDERARRRHAELRGRGVEAAVAEVLASQQKRDMQDSSRADSPLQVAAGSVVIDSTQMTPDQVVERILQELERRRAKPLDTPGGDAVKSRNHGRLAHDSGLPVEEERF